ncbi:hypothetical protein [Micromonospora haikouensis]|uniref:hypothetical protein n=1 Tax=Micromonospora haikouensis TaxID=686309 RepID=UPI003D74D31B
MSFMGALLAYADRFTAAGGVRADARAWLEGTDVSPEDAAALAAKGYTPETAAARIAAAPVKYDDERDVEGAVDAMLYGPDQ